VSTTVSVSTDTAGADGASLGKTSTWLQPLDRNPLIEIGEKGSTFSA